MVMGCISISTPLGRFVPISVLLELLATLGVSRAILPHGWPVIVESSVIKALKNPNPSI